MEIQLPVAYEIYVGWMKLSFGGTIDADGRFRCTEMEKLKQLNAKSGPSRLDGGTEHCALRLSNRNSYEFPQLFVEVRGACG